ncbi:DUF3993 domain-containing protein [Peribacillus sp. SCS-37]|uniref:DUF3993 domain-containing protein n=1 Tax=Paraperibacillus esterisolvens TaxID=3115296 RepID=UPI003905F90B
MMKKLMTVFTAMSLFFSTGITAIHAESNGSRQSHIHKESAFDVLTGAFAAQVSLSYKGQSLEGVRETLKPYFTESFIDKFIKENVVKINGAFQTLGSDAAVYYVPFFSYDKQTKLKAEEDTAVISEKFNASSEGPVGYDDHTESVHLVKEGNTWKIEDIRNSLAAEEDLEEEAAVDDGGTASAGAGANELNVLTESAAAGLGAAFAERIDLAISLVGTASISASLE